MQWQHQDLMLEPFHVAVERPRTLEERAGNLDLAHSETGGHVLQFFNPLGLHHPLL